jgi:phosphomannomutase
MLAAMHVLAALGESDVPASALLAEYERYVASGEINSTVADAAAATESVIAAFADHTASVDRLDGVTVELTDGSWFNLRASNTEPLLRLNAEAATTERVDEIVAAVLGIVRS